MPVSLTITKTGETTFTYEWSGTGPYKIFLDGTVIVDVDGDVTTDNTSIEYLSADSEEPEPLEVIDTATESDSDAENVANAPIGIFQWRGIPGVFVYRIQKDPGTGFATQAFYEHEFEDDEGGGYYKHQTPSLAHATQADWQVVPVNLFVAGNPPNNVTEYTGDPLSFTVTPRRNPAPPSISASYDGGTGDLTISAR